MILWGTPEMVASAVYDGQRAPAPGKAILRVLAERGRDRIAPARGNGAIIAFIMANDERVIHSDPDTLGGTPVFVGTRVPLQALIDYLEGGHPLAEFLDDFPSVSREQAVAALEQAKDLLVAHSAR